MSDRSTHPSDLSSNPTEPLPFPHQVDVVIVGAGLAGTSLAQHLLLDTDKTVLLLERQAQVPRTRQKVGEATVQVSGYYFSKVLDLEEYLWHDHFMKYNLRFLWPCAGRKNDAIEHYHQSYIRPFSNLPSYQLNRNKVEGELLRRSLENPRFRLATSVTQLDIALNESDGDPDAPHVVRFVHEDQPRHVMAQWVVDTTGRNRVLAKSKHMRRPSPIKHGTRFFWVDGIVNIEKLTDRSRQEIRIAKERRHTGHLPQWLATNHFAGEGYWLWVIPLQGKTSFGLVYDDATFPRERVATPEKLVDWICETFPLFARDLPQRRVHDYAGYNSFAHDCGRTIHASRWALSGEAGRFTDPLYSPGGDLISIHNTLIVDAIQTPDRTVLEAKVRSYEPLMRAVYEAYVPSYACSYDTLGDQEVFSLKYTWELTIYFAFYVFPFINDLFTDRRFILAFLRGFSRLGPWNKQLQLFLSHYYQWKKGRTEPATAPIFHEFTHLEPLAKAADTFYDVGVDVAEAKRILLQQLDNIEGLGRFIVAHAAVTVLGEPRALTDAGFIDAIDLGQVHFDPAALAEQWTRHQNGDVHDWSFCPAAVESLRATRSGNAAPVVEDALAMASGAA